MFQAVLAGVAVIKHNNNVSTKGALNYKSALLIGKTVFGMVECRFFQVRSPFGMYALINPCCVTGK